MEAVTVPLAEIEPQELKWLWPGQIPLGKLVVLCGDPGLGKSFLTLDLCARLSKGGPWPEQTEKVEAGSSLILSAEDDPADTIRPRLDNMNADVTKIHIIAGMQDPTKRVYDFVIGEHSSQLRGTIQRLGDVRLLIVDPVSAYVGGSDSYNNASVRAMLKPLSDLAADTGVTVILVTHLRKSEAAKALHSAMGSLAFTAASRLVLMVTRDPSDPDMRLLLTVKSNLTNDRVSFKYSVKEGKVVWAGTFEGQADEVLAMLKQQAEMQNSPAFLNKTKFAKAVHERLEKDGDKCMPVAEVKALAKEMGIPVQDVSRPELREFVGVEVVKIGKVWLWKALPAEIPPQ